jgi:3-hydroxyisobutyrate dehydrogenase-like beta-hydroxyacid dehydrogenase
MAERIRVYGNGRSGSAYRDRLRQQGYDVLTYDRRDGDVVCLDGEPDTEALVAILALPRGTDSPVALASIDPKQVPWVVDLTTQSPELARANADRWTELGGRTYHAGGSNGGERAVRAGHSYLLIGPRCDPAVWRALRNLGHVTEYDSVEYATTLKLCHNAFLIVENELARQLAGFCARRGISRQDLEKVVDDGPAGRRFGDLTAIRHLKGGYETSYVGEYAAKDWRHFTELLDAGERDLFGFIEADALGQRLLDRGRQPWV